MASKHQQWNTNEQFEVQTIIVPDFNKEADRLKTFDNCSNQVVLDSKHTFAVQGFYFFKEPDQVKCNFCHIVLEKWQLHDNPLADHVKYSPRCSLLNRRQTENVPLIPGELERTLPTVSYDVCGLECKGNSRYAYPEYILQSQRKRTFETWPTSMKQTAFDLVQCGFFYTGLADRVICFCCGLGLGNWEETDTPLAEHAKNNASCEYLRSTFSDDLINAVLQQNVEEFNSIKESSGDDSEKLCKICFENPTNVAFVPCGHVLCQNCAMSIEKCPICRAKITKRLKLYF